MGAPRFKSRKDNRQAIRFTANARWKITDSGRLRLPKIGDVKVKWSRALPVDAVLGHRDQGRGRAGTSPPSSSTPTRPTPPGCPTPAEVGIDLGLDPLRGPLRRHEDRLPAVPAPRGEEAEEGPAGPVPQAEGIEEPGEGPAQGRPRPRPGRRRAPRVPPPALHEADPREPSGRRGGPGGEGTRPHPAGQVRARRRLVGVRDHAGVQSAPVRAHLREDRPVRADLPGLLAPAASRTAPNPCTSGNGPAPPAAPSTTGTSTPRST